MKKIIIDTKMMGKIEICSKKEYKIFKWINKGKKRFYLLIVGYDIFGDLIMKTIWGSTISKAGGMKNKVYDDNDYSKLSKDIDRVCTMRIRNGYLLHNI